MRRLEARAPRRRRPRGGTFEASEPFQPSLTRKVAVLGASGAVSTHDTRAQPGFVATAAKRMVFGLPTAVCEKRSVTVRSLVRPTIAVATFCGASPGIVLITDPCVVSASLRAVMQAR